MGITTWEHHQFEYVIKLVQIYSDILSFGESFLRSLKPHSLLIIQNVEPKLEYQPYWEAGNWTERMRNMSKIIFPSELNITCPLKIMAEFIKRLTVYFERLKMLKCVDKYMVVYYREKSENIPFGRHCFFFDQYSISNY